jgi:putative membrane protein
MDDGIHWHPLLNACLNGCSAVAMFLAWRAIKAGDRERHKMLMLTAFGFSCAFLVSYLIRMVLGGTTPFPHGGALKVLYLSILFSHMLFAAVVPFGVIGAIALGLKGRFGAHRRLVRITFPVWQYVSVTGVVIYLMLYHL